MKQVKVLRYILLVLVALSVMSFFGAAYAWHTDHKVFKARFIPCVAALCGTNSAATLEEGEVEVMSNGEVKVELEGSNLINSTLALSYQPINGAAISIGVFNTDEYGSIDSGEDYEGHDGYDCERNTEDTFVGILNTTNSMGIFVISDAIPDENNVINNYLVTAFSTYPEEFSTPPGAFDDVDSMSELKTAYKQKTALASKGVKSQQGSLSKSLTATQSRLKQDYKSRTSELSK